MLQFGRYSIKRAQTADELEQIHRLNHRIFAEELGQHVASSDGRMVDKFHDKNIYFIALAEGHVLGMISAHDKAPFSVADRLPDAAILDRPGRRPLEVRLLAVEPAHRTGSVMAGLLWSMLEYASRQYTDVYISGIAERVDMYQRLGFRPLGPAVAHGKAAFVPMCVSFPLHETVKRLAHWWMQRSAPKTSAASAS
jgi:N-acyl-L-homoserine lactone synthetase